MATNSGIAVWARATVLAGLLLQYSVFAQLDLEFRAVDTGEDLQLAVREKVKHIVITQHLDLVDLPRFSNTTAQDNGVISTYIDTKSIRGNCTQPVETDIPRLTDTQCVLTIREDFMEIPTAGANVWLSDLYIRLAGVQDKEHSTIIGVQSGDLWMTDITMIGDGNKCRGMDVKENRSVYARNCMFINFQKDKEGVFRLASDSTATFNNCTFAINKVSSTDATKVAAGPVGGLSAGAEGDLPAAVWFYNSLFGLKESQTPGDVSIENQQCKVFSNTSYPEIWDLEKQQVLRPIPVSSGPGDIFKFDNGVAIPFKNEQDKNFLAIAEENLPGMRTFEMANVPEAGTLSIGEEYPGSGGNSHSTRNIILFCIAGAAIMFAIAAVVAYLLLCCRRHPTSASVPPSDAKDYDRKSSSLGNGLLAGHHQSPAPWVQSEVLPPSSGRTSSIHDRSRFSSGRGIDAVGSLPHDPSIPPHAGSAGTPHFEMGSNAGSYYANPPFQAGTPGSIPSETYSGQGGPLPTPLASAHANAGASVLYSDSRSSAAPERYSATDPYSGYQAQQSFSSASGNAPGHTPVYPQPPPMPSVAEVYQTQNIVQPAAWGGDTCAVAPSEDGSSHTDDGGGGGGAQLPTSAAHNERAETSGGTMDTSPALAMPPPAAPVGVGVPPSKAPAMLASNPPAPHMPTLAPVRTAPPDITTTQHSTPVTNASQERRAAPNDAHSSVASLPTDAVRQQSHHQQAGAYVPPTETPPQRMRGTAEQERQPYTGPRNTQVFDKTVAIEADMSDVSHERCVDMLEEVYAAKEKFRGKYNLLGSVHQRLGGTGVVQFARSDDGNDYALKFFIRRAAFDRVAGLHANPTMRRHMSAITGVYPNNAREQIANCVLPPCVAMVKGEPLEEWARRLRPNLPTTLFALCQAASLLRDLHASGYVYYALKPSNIAWMAKAQKWALLDFGCTARLGMRTGLSFSLNYAAPEIIAAQESGARTIPVDPAADLWALGVIAYELLTLARTFPPGTPTDEIRNMISGRLPMPWEEDEPKQLRTLKNSIMQCLSRDPKQRPTAEGIASAWNNLLDFAAVKHTEVA